jgi:hypothetical protein
MKRIATSLENKKDDSDNETFYTPPQSLSKFFFVKLEDRMFQDHNKGQSKTLLNYHETIVKQLLDLQSASFCVSPKSKRLPATYTVCHFYTSLSAECSKASLEPLVSR